MIPLLNPVPSQQARLLLAQGDVHAAAQWTTAAGLSPDDERITPQCGIWALARVLLAKDDPATTSRCCSGCSSAAASQGQASSVIEIQALRALALAARGDHASALGRADRGAHARP